MLTIEKQLVTLNQDIAGQEIGIPVYRLFDDRQKMRKKVYVQSAVHAAEMQGSAVIYRLIEHLKTLNLAAEFVLVPNCNPFGRTQRAGEYLQGRFDATTGNNWNRFYHYDRQDAVEFVRGLTDEDFEQLNKGDETSVIKRFKSHLLTQLQNKIDRDWGVNTAQFLNTTLQEMASKADLVLDLHTGPSSTRHIYAPHNLAEQAKAFNIENIISIPTSFAGALDEASFTPWWDLAELLLERGVTFNYRVDAYTVELGSQENISLDAAEQDALGILNYLSEAGFLEGFEGVPLTPSVVTELKNYKTLFSKHAGMVEYLAKPGEKVSKGQVIARVLNSLEFDSENAITEVLAPATGTIILHYPSAAVQVGTQLFKIAISEK
ncbi:MAG: succinylglutamate desuccinylase/aspartoacylase family protein [Gammaproteobacteria bacterium]|nr:succinylglutamate desuccinylase/aspartoacylase family protein [Gammaproteobacteria bacterium]